MVFELFRAKVTDWRGTSRYLRLKFKSAPNLETLTDQREFRSEGKEATKPVWIKFRVRGEWIPNRRETCLRLRRLET
ncbi:MAG: hypothetical protein ACTS5R_01595 [Candidatus Hodgkinia cicadicola]